MWFVFRKTLVDLTGWKKTLALAFVAVLISDITILGWHLDYLSFGMRTHYAVNNFLLVSYFWLSGIFLSLVVSANAAGLVSKEDSEGTLLILVSKPIERRRILYGKFLALVVKAILLEAFLLVMFAVVIKFVLQIDGNTFCAILESILWILVYSLLIILLFGSAAMALSTITKNMIAIMVIMAGFVSVSFLIGPMARYTTSHDSYVDSHVYWIDPSYHIQNTFIIFRSGIDGGWLVPQYEDSWIGSDGVFLEQESISVDGIEGYYPERSLNLVDPIFSALILVMASAIFMEIAMRAFERKEVH